MHCLALPILVAATSPVLSPARALLESTYAPVLVAQAPEAEVDDAPPAAPPPTGEQENLEQDMDRAREHLGHKEDHRHEPPHQNWRRYDRRDELTRERSRRLYEPTIEGHGKSYYLTWAIVDYAIAGQLWLGGTLGTLLALTVGINADQIAEGSGENFCDGDCSDKDTANALRASAIVWGAASIGAVVTGFVFASKAETNLDKHGTLSMAARSGGPRPRSDRAWDEHEYEHDSEVEFDEP